jgi:hypothetical protein
MANLLRIILKLSTMNPELSILLNLFIPVAMMLLGLSVLTLSAAIGVADPGILKKTLQHPSFLELELALLCWQMTLWVIHLGKSAFPKARILRDHINKAFLHAESMMRKEAMESGEEKEGSLYLNFKFLFILFYFFPSANNSNNIKISSECTKYDSILYKKSFSSTNIFLF